MCGAPSSPTARAATSWPTPPSSVRSPRTGCVTWAPWPDSSPTRTPPRLLQQPSKRREVWSSQRDRRRPPAPELLRTHGCGRRCSAPRGNELPPPKQSIPVRKPDPMTHSSTPPATSSVAAFGYTETLERSTGRFASFAVAFAFVSIATGIFTTYGSVLKSSGPLGIWTWPIVVVGQLAVALLLGSLAARIPVTGYAYQWVSRLATPILGWITGWISFTFLAIVVVAVDYTVASTVVPALFDFTGTAATAFLITAVVLLLQALLVALSTKWTERVNNFAVTAELIGMVALVVLLFIVGVIAHKLSVGTLFSRGDIPADGYWSFGTATSAGPWMLGFLLGAFTIVGFESAANLAEETMQPEIVGPRALLH